MASLTRSALVRRTLWCSVMLTSAAGLEATQPDFYDSIAVISGNVTDWS